MKKADEDIKTGASESTNGDAKAGTAAAKQPGACSWRVTVKNNPAYCGVGAGGIQFAYGKAVIQSERMARWFKEHAGYEVEEQQGG